MLVDLGFIRVAPRGDSEFGYVLIVNPYIPVRATSSCDSFSRAASSAGSDPWGRDSAALSDIGEPTLRWSRRTPPASVRGLSLDPRLTTTDEPDAGPGPSGTVAVRPHRLDGE